MPSRPELAVYIARIATGWSHAEQRLGMLVVQLLGAHADTGMKMYQALSGAASQKAVLRAVARDRLNPEAMERLETILSDYKKVAQQRNAVVHGKWEISDDHPDDLVWSDAGEYLLAHSEFWAGYSSHEDDHERMDWMRTWTHEPHKYLLYDEDDLFDILESIRDLESALQSFTLDVHKMGKPRSDKSGLRSAQGPGKPVA